LQWWVSCLNLPSLVKLPLLPVLEGWYPGWLGEYLDGRYNTGAVFDSVFERVAAIFNGPPQ
jgi:hypothetical protein